MVAVEGESVTETGMASVGSEVASTDRLGNLRVCRVRETACVDWQRRSFWQ